jgi:tetratricopeptide (TPR) repeat protein
MPDTEETPQRAATTREFPDTPLEAWLLAARDAVGDEAFTLLSHAAARFPTAWQVQHDLARAAERRADWVTAEQAWRTCLTLVPDKWWAFTGLANSFSKRGRFDEADAVLLEASTKLPNEVPLAVERARLSEARTDWCGALVRWDEMMANWPDRCEGPLGKASALSHLARDAEAQEVLTQATERFPRREEVFHDLARLAEKRNDWPTAEQAWRRFIFINSTNSWAHAGLANSLIKQNLLSEAEAGLEIALQSLPHDPAITSHLARVAEARKDWPEALTRWDRVVAESPTLWAGYRGKAAVLRVMGRFEESEGLIAEHGARFSNDKDALHDLARVAEQRRDWAGAEAAWRAFLKLETRMGWAYIGLADSLRQQERLNHAEDVLVVAQHCLQNESQVFVEHAKLAAARHDWNTALARFEAIRARFPHIWAGYAGAAEALRALDRIEESRAVLRDAAAHLPNEAAPFHDLGRLAELSNDWLEAERCWRAFLARDDRPFWAHMSLAAALREQGRLDEAEALLIAVQEHKSTESLDQSSLFREYAIIAERQGDWIQAESCWRKVVAANPGADWPIPSLATAINKNRAAGQPHKTDRIFCVLESFSESILQQNPSVQFRKLHSKTSQLFPAAAFCFGDAPRHVVAGGHSEIHDTGAYLVEDADLAHVRVIRRGETVLFGGEIGVAKGDVENILNNERRLPLDELRPREATRPLVVPLAGAYRGYGHWIVEVLPEVFSAQKLGYNLTDCDFAFPNELLDFAWSFLDYMGISKKQIFSYDAFTEIVRSKHLIVPTLMHNGRVFSDCFGEATRWLQQNVEERHGPLFDARKPRRVFVRRPGGNRFSPRELFNRDELIEIAKSFDFEIIAPETLPLIEQWRCFASANLIVGEYGSALHSSIFSRPGTVVCCLRGSPDVPGYLQSGIGEIHEQPTGYVFGEPCMNGSDGAYVIDAGTFTRCLEAVTSNVTPCGSLDG